MKKEKIVMSITIGISAFILVAVIFMQFKVVEKTDKTAIELMTESELRSELISWREKYDQLQAQYQDTLTKLEDYKQEFKSYEETEALLKSELIELGTALGETDVQGEGIIITISEDNVQENKINYEDLLYIVNELKSAGAEAISINGNRVINRTDIYPIGMNATDGGYIQVNSKRILSPYIIKAIGNQTYLEGALLGNGGYADELKKWGFEIQIERNENVQIDAYSSSLSMKYIN